MQTNFKFITVFFALLAISFSTMAQTPQAALTPPTMPEPQSLPYTQDFGSFTGKTSKYPAGWQGWIVAKAVPSGTGRVNVPLTDHKIGGGTAASAKTGLYDFNGKIGFLSAGSDLALCLAVNTTGKSNVNVTFDAMTMRNSYDGATKESGFQYGLLLQYRVGTTGNFTNLAYLPSPYNTGSAIQISGKEGLNVVTELKALLPASCDNQPIVQIRWKAKVITGVKPAERPSFAIDNVAIK